MGEGRGGVGWRGFGIPVAQRILGVMSEQLLKVPGEIKKDHEI